jgi:hypothetical protein
MGSLVAGALILAAAALASGQSDGLGGALERQQQELTRPHAPAQPEAPSQPSLERERQEQERRRRQELEQQQLRGTTPLPPGCTRVGDQIMCR